MLDCARLRRTRRLHIPVLPLLLVALASVSAAVAQSSPAPDGLKPRTLPAKSLLLALGTDADPRDLIVKLADDAALDARGGRWVAEAPAAAAPRLLGSAWTKKAPAGEEARGTRVAARTVSKVGAALAPFSGASVERLIPVPRGVLDLLRRAGEANTGEALADLSQYYRVRLPAGAPGQGAALLDKLLALPEVENAYAYRRYRHPVDVPPTTPDFLNNPPGQGYRNAAPLGIDVAAATAASVTGAAVTVADVETNWNLSHEDLDHLVAQVPPVPVVPPSDWRDPALPAQTNVNHGTATLGVLASGSNGYGTTGLAPGAKIRVVPIFRQSLPLWSAPTAVVYATLALQRGDVMLLEVEDGSGLPFEAFDVEFSVVRQATALGIHVVEPAGNTPGGTFLDTDPQVLDPQTGKSKFDWAFRDSGAILVGGGQSVLGAGGGFHNRYVNSNFGTRVDAYSWGQNVTTLGFGP
jgi:hypothetical protein